jgi:hypothetical protein
MAFLVGVTGAGLSHQVFGVWDIEVFDNLGSAVGTIWVEGVGLRSDSTQTPPPRRAKTT